MYKALVAVLLLALVSFRGTEKEFSGRIVYHNTFTSLDGADLTARLAPFLGTEQWYYIGNGQYKAYNEKKELVQLYDKATSQYQYYKGGKLLQSFDVTKANGGEAQVSMLDETATIAGYPCKALQIASDGVTTTYYYAPSLKVNPEAYAKHPFGNWYAYLKATQGALTLKYVIKDPLQGYIMTSEAVSVKAMPLKATDFTATAVAR